MCNRASDKVAWNSLDFRTVRNLVGEEVAWALLRGPGNGN